MACPTKRRNASEIAVSRPRVLIAKHVRLHRRVASPIGIQPQANVGLTRDSSIRVPLDWRVRVRFVKRREAWWETLWT